MSLLGVLKFNGNFQTCFLQHFSVVCVYGRCIEDLRSLLLSANGRAVAAHSKADATACNAAEVSDMSEAAQAEGGIVIKDKRFDFETCEKIGLYRENVRFPSLLDVA